MIKVLNYYIKGDRYGYTIFHKDKVKIDKRNGKSVPIDPLFTGNIRDALKLVLRESVRDWMEDTRDEELTVRDLLQKICELDFKIEEITKGL